MKKLLLSVFIILAACQSAPGEEKFVNPLFYKTLEPLSQSSWTTYLSPTQIRTTNEGYEETAACEMLENTFEKVSFKCTFFNKLTNSNETNLYSYVVYPCDEYTCLYGRWTVEEYSAELDGEVFSLSTFVIADD